MASDHSRESSADAAVAGAIHSFESFGTVDGPGARFVVFLQGCQFRCKYCHNRDTWDPSRGTIYSVPEVVREIQPYEAFLRSSGGGVTISGGEPLLQRRFVCALLQSLKGRGLHTCLDTNGYLLEYSDLTHRLIDHVDLVLLDIKQIDPEKHVALVGIHNAATLRFARYLAERCKPVWVRYVVVPGFNDDDASVHALAGFVRSLGDIVQRLELLPYHELGKHKWQAVGDPYPLVRIIPPSEVQMSRLIELCSEYDLPVVPCLG